MLVEMTSTDYLEVGDNKKALHEADKLLKKQSTLEAAKVLKALSLLRLGQRRECERIVSEVHDQAPTESCALRAMRACYTELSRLDLLCEAYDNAIRRDPTDLDLHLQLYSTYLRQSDYKRAQQLALLMNKRFPSGPYFLWAVMGLCLQTIRTTDRSIAERALLPLARRLLEKSFEPSGKPKSEPELQLYLHVLELQNDYRPALMALEQDETLNDDKLGFVSRRRATYLRRLNEPMKAFDLLVKLVRRFPDQIESYEQIIDIALNIPLPAVQDWSVYAPIAPVDIDPTVESNALNQSNGSEEYVDAINTDIVEDRNLLNEAIDLMNEMLSADTTATVRAPLVAKLNLLRKFHGSARHAKISERLGGDDVEQLFAFFERFAHKAASLLDLAFLVQLQELTAKQRKQLSDRVRQKIENDAIDDFNSLNRHNVSVSLQISAGQFDEPLCAESIGKLRSMLDLHQQVGSWSANQTSRTDFNSAEPLVQLVVQILDAQVFTNDACLWHALTCLWRATRVPSPNYTQRLLLVQAFAACGAAACVTDLFLQLDFKHIQRDSLGYFAYSSSESAQFSQAAKLQTSALQFYHWSAKETSEQLLNCFQCESYERIGELLKLNNQLTHSVYRAYVYVSRPLLDLLQKSRTADSVAAWLLALNIAPFDPHFNWNRLSDNRDVTVLRAAPLPVSLRSRHDRDVTSKQLRLLCQTRELAVRLLVAAPRITCSSSATLQADKLSYCQLLQQYERFVQHVHDSNLESRKQSLFAPQSVGFEMFRDSGICNVLIDAYRLPLQLIESQLEVTQEQLQTSLFDKFAVLIEKLKNTYENMTQLSRVTSLFEHVHWILETIAIFTTMIQLVWLRHNGSNPPSATKGAKDKKKSSAASASHQKLIRFLIEKSEKVFHELRDFLQTIQFAKVLKFESILSPEDYLCDSSVINDSFRPFVYNLN
jgi:N-terminal acetyltransferase B complex non-catalytic subunit